MDLKEIVSFSLSLSFLPWREGQAVLSLGAVLRQIASVGSLASDFTFTACRLNSGRVNSVTLLQLRIQITDADCLTFSHLAIYVPIRPMHYLSRYKYGTTL